MKPLNLILPITVAVFVAGAYLAGRYVGDYDAQKIHALAGKLQASSESANLLYIAGAVADLLKDSKSSDALRVLEQYARVQAPAVDACLKASDCSWWAAATEERRVALQRYVKTYGGTDATQSTK